MNRRRPKAPDGPSAARMRSRSAWSGPRSRSCRRCPPPTRRASTPTPGRHDALIRFSSASNHLGPDAQLGPVLGFAIKIFDVDGPKLVDDEPDAPTFDLVLKNNPTFIANTARHYLFIQEIGNDAPKYLARGKAGFHELLSDLLTGRGLLERSDWAWDGAVRVREGERRRRCATRCSRRTGRWPRPVTATMSRRSRVAPAAESAAHAIHRKLDLDSGPDVFGPALVEELKARAFDFDLQVQLCTDLDAMPVNDVTVEWPETLSPFVTVGRVHLARQDISENSEKGDALAFNQWRVTADHRPLGEIMNVRRIYSASAKVRRALNRQPQTEPASADSALA